MEMETLNDKDLPGALEVMGDKLALLYFSRGGEERYPELWKNLEGLIKIMRERYTLYLFRHQGRNVNLKEHWVPPRSAARRGTILILQGGKLSPFVEVGPVPRKK